MLDINSLALYLVTDRGLSLGRPIEEIVAESVRGGVTMVQLREKDASTAEFVELACRLKAELAPWGVPLIINDRIDVALACDAEGVHIGQSDMPYETARKILGPDKIIGLSVETVEQIEEANRLDVDYIGISPVFATGTKTDTAEPWGLEGLSYAVKHSVHPTVAIGGVNMHTADSVSATGTDGLAVVSAICSAKDPKVAAEQLCDVFYRYKWTARAWNQSRKVYMDILSHPFVKTLADGTLPREAFLRYVAQDEQYLKNYGREMDLVSGLMTEPRSKELLHELATAGVEAENAMHALLIDSLGGSFEPVEPSNVTNAYCNYIMERIATGNKAIALAAILPCAWVYNEVGLHIFRTGYRDDNPYKEWIGAYSSEEFTSQVSELLSMANRLAAEADEETRCAMTEAYVKACEYELAFWEYGWSGTYTL